MEWDKKIPLGRQDLQDYLDRRVLGYIAARRKKNPVDPVNPV